MSLRGLTAVCQLAPLNLHLRNFKCSFFLGKSLRTLLHLWPTGIMPSPSSVCEGIAHIHKIWHVRPWRASRSCKELYIALNIVSRKAWSASACSALLLWLSPEPQRSCATVRVHVQPAPCGRLLPQGRSRRQRKHWQSHSLPVVMQLCKALSCWGFKRLRSPESRLKREAASYWQKHFPLLRSV